MSSTPAQAKPVTDQCARALIEVLGYCNNMEVRRRIERGQQLISDIERKGIHFVIVSACMTCQDCTLKSQYCPNTSIRKIELSPYEPARDVARATSKTDTYKQSRKDRKW